MDWTSALQRICTTGKDTLHTYGFTHLVGQVVCCIGGQWLSGPICQYMLPIYHISIPGAALGLSFLKKAAYIARPERTLFCVPVRVKRVKFKETIYTQTYIGYLLLHYENINTGLQKPISVKPYTKNCTKWRIVS